MTVRDVNAWLWKHSHSVVHCRLWIAIGFILIVGASLVALILPIWEARALCIAVMKGIFTGRQPKRPLKPDGTEYSVQDAVVIGDADVGTSAGKVSGTVDMVGGQPEEFNDSAHGGRAANAALKLSA